MVDRYCRLVCDSGLSPDAILAFTFTDKAAAELRQRIRAELARRAERGSERAAALLAGIGGAWVTTIHGFCNRLLAAHPVAAGIDPGFRVLDAPEAAGPRARPSTSRWPSSSPSGRRGRARGDRRRLRRRRAAGGDRRASTPSCAAAASPSRGCPSRRQPTPRRRSPRAIEAAGECLRGAEARSDGERELLERALARLGAPGPRARPRRAARRCAPTARRRRSPPTGRRSRRRSRAGRRGRRGRRGLRPPGRAAGAVLGPLRGGEGTPRRDRLRGPADPRRAAAGAGRDRRALPRPLPPAPGRRVPGHQPAAAAADRGAARAEAPSWSWSATSCSRSTASATPTSTSSAAGARRSTARADAELMRAERQLPLAAGGDRRRQPASARRCSARPTGRCGSAPPPHEREPPPAAGRRSSCC